MTLCDDVKLPGVSTILGAHDGKVIVRWRDDPESDYRVERPHPMLCLLLITRLGYRVDVDSTPDDAA